MPSTFSPNLRIELIAQGEQANTWGVTTNNNLGTLIGDAIAGLVDVDVTSSDVTLTALDGLSDQARNMMIVVTGSAGLARSVFCPDGDTKVYVVANDSNVVVTFSTVSGTGVDIPAGASKFVYCDGIDVYESVTAIDTLLLGGAPTTSLEAANKGYVDAAIAAINYTANRAVVTNGSGNLAASAATSTEVGYLSGVTSAIQTQLNNKPSLTGSGASGTWGINVSGNAATATQGPINSGFPVYNFDAGGYALRVVPNASSGIIQWTNAAQSAQWTSLVGTLNSLQCTTAFSASSFSGSGSGLTGTASSLSIGGNAATATTAAACSGNAATASNPASGGTFITSSNIGSQSVNYATSAGSASSATNATNASNSTTTSQTNFSNLTIAGSQVVTAANIGSYAPTSFAAGTRIVFAQASAPSGWTQVTTYNNYALRIVSGTGAGTGGSVGFTTAFASQSTSGTVGSHTLTIAEMPNHSHSLTPAGSFVTSFNQVGPSSGGTEAYLGGIASPSVSSTGGGGGHDHTFTGSAINLAVQYVDAIICQKN